MPTYPLPTPIYHFTHINNLSSVIQSGCILCKNAMSQQKRNYTSSAYASVQSHRQQHQVPVYPFGTIHDYVPFYFNSRSPMLYTIKCGNVAGVEMKDLVFFKSTVQIVQSSGALFAFTDGHGIMDLSDYYNNSSDLSELPWNVIQAQYWNQYDDGKRLRQAEFLVHNQFSLDMISEIGVYNEDLRVAVERLLIGYPNLPSAEIKRSWYF